jgi:hypothetical protein
MVMIARAPDENIEASIGFKADEYISLILTDLMLDQKRPFEIVLKKALAKELLSAILTVSVANNVEVIR